MDGSAVIVFGFLAVWVIVAHATKVLRTHARERTRREVAAYIAEGSMTPEQGERLLRAGAERD